MIFAKFGFDIGASVDFIVFFFFVTAIPVFRSSFPKFWICFQFYFCHFVSGLTVFFPIRRFGNLFPSVPSSRCCEGSALLSSSAGMNYL